MKILLGADPHVSSRTPDDLKWSLLVWEDAYILAERHKATCVAWLGDILHFKYGVELRLLLGLNEVIHRYQEKGISTIIIPGNHDKPWEDRPDEVAVKLLSGNIYTEPTILGAEGHVLCFLPWYPHVEFKAKVRDLATQMVGYKGYKFLFSHTPLAEGSLSPSNHVIDQPVRIADLYTDVWDQVFLGDYHTEQQLGPKVHYLGAPRPRTFGDAGQVGYHLFDLTPTAWTLTPLPLPRAYPKYVKVRIGPFGPPEIPDYDPKNHYRVETYSIWFHELVQKYPKVPISRMPGESVTLPANVWIPTDEKGDPPKVIQRWMNLKNLDLSIFGPLNERFLNQCLYQR